jgi:uncharacterized protein (TIGR02145 family)
MNFITQQGRALLLMAMVVVGAVCVSNGQTRPPELLGRWFCVDGFAWGNVEAYKEMSLELFEDGTGIWTYGTGYVEGLLGGGFDESQSVTWKVMGNRFVLSERDGEGWACDYKLSGGELVFIYDNKKSATFVRKERVNEYVKKKAEEKAEQKRIEAERIKKEKEQRIEKITSYFTDSRDGRKYRAVKIGSKSWTAQNLNYQTGNSWCYGGNNSNCEKYGRLYAWNTAKTACPTGWHLPSREEWDVLVIEAGGNVAGKALKSTYGWDSDGDGTDEFGFSALPGGDRGTDDSFLSVGKDGFWWTATEDGSCCAYYRRMGSSKGSVLEDGIGKRNGKSVRCIQN